MVPNLDSRWRVLLVTALLLPALGHCVSDRGSRPPGVEIERARATARSAIAHLREHSPHEAQHLEQLLVEAERRHARRTEGLGSGPAAAADQAWLDLLGRVVAALRAQDASFAAERQRWLVARERTQEVLARARLVVGRAEVGRSEAAALARTEVRLAGAERAAVAGDFPRAAQLAEEAWESARSADQQLAEAVSRLTDPANQRRWAALVDETIAETRRNRSRAVVVDKLNRRLEVYEAGARRAVFVAELGVNGLEQKTHAGDRATPEGRYRAVEMRSGGATRFYKAILLDYPNARDRERFRDLQAQGQVPKSASGAGTLIEIHGEGGKGSDWTNGCVALHNDDMDLLFELVDVGTPITIVGAHER
jgi:L,D-peptidoglycan transpeptidase YkuD (ErfK/YbiS/YcfS/YnhG family)